MYRIYADAHIIPALGKRKLRQLTVEDIEKLLHEKSAILGTRSLKIIHSILNRAVTHAQARDKVRRNVVTLCNVPVGRQGRPSKSLTLDQAVAILQASEKSSLHAYIVLSLLTGARTEELRALRWCHVDLARNPDADPPLPPSIAIWRSIRAGGDTKTRKSRRTWPWPSDVSTRSPRCGISAGASMVPNATASSSPPGPGHHATGTTSCAASARWSQQPA